MILDVSHLMLLDSQHLHLAPPSTENTIFRFLTPEDVQLLSADDSYDLESSLSERLKSDQHLCFGAFQDGALAGYVWLAFGSVAAECNRGASIQSGVGLSFPPKMAFLYKGFVHPNYRGQKLYGQIVTQALQKLSHRDTTQILSTADWTNASALKSCYSTGYEFLGTIWRFGTRWRMFTLFPKIARQLGIAPKA